MITSTANYAANIRKPAGTPKAGPEMGTGMSIKSLKEALRELKGDELKATSVVEMGFGPGGPDYRGLIIVSNNQQMPKCPNEKLPVNNQALKTMVEALSDYYGSKADNAEVAFLKGGFNPPGYCQITLLKSDGSPTGLGLYFSKETGEPMGKLTGKL
ncbi:MAG: hypothetical protein HYU64_20380 [Armatimonadetes bacterium]|nr:hypothetical protein [Armatimonadota bacterium]